MINNVSVLILASLHGYRLLYREVFSNCMYLAGPLSFKFLCFGRKFTQSHRQRRQNFDQPPWLAGLFAFHLYHQSLSERIVSILLLGQSFFGYPGEAGSSGAGLNKVANLLFSGCKVRIVVVVSC